MTISKDDLADITAALNPPPAAKTKNMFDRDHIVTLLIAVVAWFAVQMFNDIREDPNELKNTIGNIQIDVAATKSDIGVIKSQLSAAEKLADSAGKDRYTRSMAESDKELTVQRFERAEAAIEDITSVLRERRK